MSTSVARSNAGDNVHIAWRASTNADEKRCSPRIDLKTDVSFRNASGQRCVARLRNISPTGIQVNCNVAIAQVLHPGGGRICSTNAPIVQTELELPLLESSASLSVCSRLRYVASSAEGPCCVIGLEFLDPRPLARRLIDEFFNTKMREHFMAPAPRFAG